MELSDKKGIQHIVCSLAAQGIQRFVICPGSRNAPLTLSFNRHPQFVLYSIRDERSAAFFAMGMAQQLNEPVGLVCTSGSAALNFAPAIAEAYYQRIPLIILTADRPKTWTDQGEGQTINQTNVFKNFVRKAYELNGEAQLKDELWYIDRCISEGLNLAKYINKGPVHFNIPVAEPLYGITNIERVEVNSFLIEPIENHLPTTTLQKLSTTFSQAKRILILVGQQRSNSALEAILQELSELENVIILCESTSNIQSKNFILNIDRAITNLPEEKAEILKPDLLITLGSAIISKRIKTFLRKHRPQLHWNIHPFDATMDTYQSLTNSISMEPLSFFQQLKPHVLSPASDYSKQWHQIAEKKLSYHNQFISQSSFSDFSVFAAIYQALPANYHVYIANSSPIRYAQLFDNRKIVETFSNRGTSGIDGCTSTVIGAAVAMPQKNFLLITGDVAFMYDVNALWQEYPVDNVKIILLNNGGGGIFRIIDGPEKEQELTQFFETQTNTNVEHLALQYRWQYLSLRQSSSTKLILDRFFEIETKRTILEIFTDAEMNPMVLNDYWQFLNK
ncbi:MAG: 2-succinyl-5-enolpyruvyl-6-hydroxy-3-cyclohexene-1-carboxylic-acid synthase [Bacteroidetes bacterium]|nr:2-succinyl-5-enolpyruvyl-6-hydroxy-3-cyclohexene-1-carboxylic-acid synthase [Bacteroidota bacterium]MBS1739150.1 2-succinyl-5-enolpyruvyl-6-hydroxy-3-cyclohexene-1-carboxylic-acid synthase [Bacteroidota bacterium]